jgi:threonine synthase
LEKHLASTLSGEVRAFSVLEEFTGSGESLEVVQPGIENARIQVGRTIWERFGQFLPFEGYDAGLSLGEGGTALVHSTALGRHVGLRSVLLKNESTNPTWSFKDRGSLTCVLMAKEMGESVLATISTGNMGASIAAYSGRAGIRAIIFVPTFCPVEKIRPMLVHGATVVQVDSPDYSHMKKMVLGLAQALSLRVVSGNGPVRTEGYKFSAFEMYEQMDGAVPDFIAVPTSACGHIRGIFKGYLEMHAAGLVSRLPRMVVVQAANNSPLVTAFRRREPEPVPFRNVHTIAEAITTGNPMGGAEILDKAYRHDWLAEDVTEIEIVEAQRTLAREGFFVEPASATSLAAVRKLVGSGAIDPDASVVLMLTGSGLKDLSVFNEQPVDITSTTVDNLERDVAALLER